MGEIIEGSEFKNEETGSVCGYVTVDEYMYSGPEFKYQKQWDENGYASVEVNLKPKDAYSLGYQDAVREIKQWLEEEIQTNYDWTFDSPKENGICGDYTDKWEFLMVFYNKFEKG